ncbi:antibiotic biosynthesis monooxygenase [Rhodobacteraceae bacterium]|nr:antibiotic biosynthesis monooxygenase [Paracoccaceae bacterium]
MSDDAPAILIYATYRVQAHDLEAFRDVATRMAEAARSRDGCTFLDVAEEVGAQGTFRLIEGWRDQGALDMHLSSKDFQAILAEAGDLAIIERRADAYSIASRTSLDMSS